MVSPNFFFPRSYYHKVLQDSISSIANGNEEEFAAE